MAYRALTFDCYGTLIDWESGIWNALQPMLSRGHQTVTRNEALEVFAEFESAEEAARPAALYPSILRTVHRGMAARLDRATTSELDDAFAGSVGDWPAFDDSARALRRLGERFKLVALSNIDRAGFAGSAARLGVDFDAVYTAEDIGSYKPDLANFDFLITKMRETFQVEPMQILHVAQSVFHDLVPASEAGLDMAWIDRQGLADGGDWGATAKVHNIPPAKFVFPSMSAFADDALRG